MKQYPVNLKIDYSEASNKLTALIRLFLVIPVFIVLTLISSYAEALSLAVALIVHFASRPKLRRYYYSKFDKN